MSIPKYPNSNHFRFIYFEIRYSRTDVWDVLRELIHVIYYKRNNLKFKRKICFDTKKKTEMLILIKI
jgi:hypothetical protein